MITKAIARGRWVCGHRAIARNGSAAKTFPRQPVAFGHTFPGTGDPHPQRTVPLGSRKATSPSPCRINPGEGTITLLGSGSVAAQLGEAVLVDEYQFVVVPVALGGGRTVFTKGAALTRIDQRAFKNGNVVVTYAV